MISTRAVATVTIELELGSEYGGGWTFEAIQKDARRAVASRVGRLQQDNEDIRSARLVKLQAVSVEEEA